MDKSKARDSWPQLMVLAQAGDQLAYTRLLKALVPVIRSLVRKQISDEVLTEDVIQDVLLTLPGAVSFPLADLLAGKKLPVESPAQQVIFHCQSGMRTEQNRELLTRAAAPAPAIILDGGLNNWKRARLPVEQDKRQPRPLMQQVQIVAGSLILIGQLLGFTLHPGFFLLSAFVGAGLLFAGLSGWCGMALLLAKMPWNRP